MNEIRNVNGEYFVYHVEGVSGPYKRYKDAVAASVRLEKERLKRRKA